MARQAQKQTKKKQRLVSQEEYCTFIVEIIDWELPYSFSINHNDKYDSAPYSEYLHMHLKGLLREPKKLGGKELDITIIGDRSLILEKKNSLPPDIPNRVGTVTMRGESRSFIGSLPFDSLPIIACLLESKRAKYLELHGRTPFRGNAATSEVHFLKSYNPEDW